MTIQKYLNAISYGNTWKHNTIQFSVMRFIIEWLFKKALQTPANSENIQQSTMRNLEVVILYKQKSSLSSDTQSNKQKPHQPHLFILIILRNSMLKFLCYIQMVCTSRVWWPYAVLVLAMLYFIGVNIQVLERYFRINASIISYILLVLYELNQFIWVFQYIP